MALMKCPECGREISDRAKACPHCGFPITEEMRREVEGPAEEAGKSVENPLTAAENQEKPQKKRTKVGVIAIVLIIVSIAGGAIAYFVLTADSRNYNSAMELFENEKFQEAMDAFEELEGYKDSEKMVEKCQYELSVDGQFMRALSKGLMLRWDESEEQAAQGILEDGNAYSRYCEIELENIEDFSSQTFNNTDLQKDVKLYIECLKTAKDATKYYTVDYNTFHTQWSETYADRTLLLKKFIDEYGLVVDEKYQETLDDLMVDASAAQEQQDIKADIQEMTKGFKLETTEDEWGLKTHKIIMKNTTDQTFDYFYLQINLQDEGGKIVESGSSDQVTSWKPDQEAEVSVWFAAEVEPKDYVIEYIPRYQSGTFYE